MDGWGAPDVKIRMPIYHPELRPADGAPNSQNKNSSVTLTAEDGAPRILLPELH